MCKPSHLRIELTPFTGAIRNHNPGAMALHAKGAVIVVLMLLAILAPLSSVHAQDEQTPTPIPTATPAPMYQVTLPSGNLMQIDRTVSYGDIFIVCAIILFTIIFTVFQILRFTHVSSDE